MQFSTKAEYGLRAMVALARAYPAQKNITEISQEENISAKYLETLIGKLRKNNLVKSQKGKSGGYTLIKNPKNISAGEIIEIMEGPIVSKCDGSNCMKAKVCASSLVWNKLAFQIKKTLFAIKLSELI
ncbi:MAG: Rrf2 family transcriptional regulator [Candidatus Moraniibacteriota bacterium]